MQPATTRFKTRKGEGGMSYLPIKSYKKGFTLVEVLVVITIVAIIVTMGLSAYAKSQERQTVQSAKETILTILNDAQKVAHVGDKACTGNITGVEISLTSSSISRQTHCNLDSESVVTDNFTDLTFTNIPSNFTFQPLSGGISFSAGSSANIDYTISGVTYRITISNPGSISYVGQIAP